MESELKVGLPIIAGGQLAVVCRLLADFMLEIEFSKDRKRAVVSIDEIELIPNIEVGGISRPPVAPDLYKELEHSPEVTAEAFKRYQVLCKYGDNIFTVKEAAYELGLSEARVYQLLRNFDSRLGVSTVMRNRRGRKKGARLLGKGQDEIISSCIRKYYKGAGATATNVHQKIDSICQGKGVETPSLATVRRRINELSPYDRLKATHGADYANDKLGAKPGKTPTERPLDLVQIDHTLVDVFVVDEETGKDPLRPWLTVFVDSYSRVVLGFYLALHAPSALSLSVGITMASTPKAEFLNYIGVKAVRYPFYGKPKKIYTDNAAEFRSPKFISACHLNEIEIDWRPIGRKNWGGIVERLLGTLMKKTHLLPGTTYSNVTQRPKDQSEIRPVMTFPRLLSWMTTKIEEYHHTPHKGLNGRTPSEVWNRAFTSDKGEIEYPPLINDPYKFKISFLPEATRSIRSRGIEFKRQCYFSHALVPFMGKKNVRIKYDPFRMKKIWVVIGEKYIEAHYDLAKPDMSLSELERFDRSMSKSAHPELREIRAESELQVKLSKKEVRQARAKKSYLLTDVPLTNSEVVRRSAEPLKPASSKKFVPTPYDIEE